MLDKFFSQDPEHKEYSEDNYQEEFNASHEEISLPLMPMQKPYPLLPTANALPKASDERQKGFPWLVITASLILLVGIFGQVLLAPKIDADSDIHGVFMSLLFGLIVGGMSAIISAILAVIALFCKKNKVAPIILIVVAFLVIALEIVIIGFGPFYLWGASNEIARLSQ